MNEKNVQFITIQQMKTSYLQSSVKISQLQARLSKNPYLSTTSLPSNADAKVFLLIQRLKKIPNKLLHPHLYHWFIIMKQFATRTLQAWQRNDDDTDELIQQFIFQMDQIIQKQIRQKSHGLNKNIIVPQSSIRTPKNQHKRKVSQNYNQNINLRQNCPVDQKQLKIPYQKRTPLNLITDINQFSSPRFQQQYIMEMQLFVVNPNSLQMLRERLNQQKVQIISFDLQDEINLRVIFRIQQEQIEQIKDKIAKWSQVSNIRFRKEKKMGNKVEAKTQKCIYSPIRKLA